MRGIAQAFQEYKQLKLLKNPIKGIYILLFLLMTLIIVFSVTWFGLYLARGITGPIQQLAEGTREVAAGNLDYKVTARADDEIGILVDSFNQMTQRPRQSSKAKLELAYARPPGQARRAGGAAALHRDRAGGGGHRRGLARTPRGIVTTDQPRRRAACSAWRRARPRGRHYAVGVPPPGVRARSSTLMQRMARLRDGHASSARCTCAADGQALTLLASATALRRAGRRATWASCWSSTTSPSCSRPSAWPPGGRSPSASPTRSRTRSRRSSSPPSGCGAGSAGRQRRRAAASSRSAPPRSSRRSRGSGGWSTSSRASRACPRFAPKPTDLAPAARGRGWCSTASRIPGLAIRAAFAPDLPPLEVDPDQHQARGAEPRRQRGGGGGRRRRGRGRDALAARGAARRASWSADNGPGHRRRGPRPRSSCPTSRRRPPAWGSACPSCTRSCPTTAGTIRVEDNAPRGSRFVIELPAGRPRGRAGARPERHGRRAHPDRRRRARRSGRRSRGVLEDEGYRVARGGHRRARPSPGSATRRRTSSSSTSGCRDGRPRGAGRAQAAAARAAVVMISGHGTIETAVKATKLGAYDFIEKPLSLEKTLLVVERARSSTRGSSARTASSASSSSAAHEIVGTSARHRRAPPADRHRGARRTAAC